MEIFKLTGCAIRLLSGKVEALSQPGSTKAAGCWMFSSSLRLLQFNYTTGQTVQNSASCIKNSAFTGVL